MERMQMSRSCCSSILPGTKWRRFTGLLGGPSLGGGSNPEQFCWPVSHRTFTVLRQRRAVPDSKKNGLLRTRHCAEVSANVMVPVLGSEGDLTGPSTGPVEEQSLLMLLVEFRNGGGPADGRVTFPPTLTAKQRRRAHEIAERLGLGHISLGQGNKRCFTAWRMSVAERLSRFHKVRTYSSSMWRSQHLWQISNSSSLCSHGGH